MLSVRIKELQAVKYLIENEEAWGCSRVGVRERMREALKLIDRAAGQLQEANDEYDECSRSTGLTSKK